MHVLFDHQVFSYQQVGGVSRYFSELNRHLPACGCQVSTGFTRTVNRYLLGQGFQNFLGPGLFKGKTHILAAWNKIYSIQALKAGNFDVFHPTYYDPYFLRHLGSKPFVLTIHDMIHEMFPDSVSDAEAVQRNKRLLAHKAAMVITISENTRQDVIRILGVPTEKVATIYLGNDLTPASVRPAKLELPRRFILYVGGRATYKNVQTLWRAFGKLTQSQPDVLLIHVGGGSLSPTELQIIRDLGIEKKVLMYSVDDQGLAALYQAALCLAYPSKYEGFGMPLVEAMAWNCPVIAARASSLPEIGGDAVQYADPNDVAEWEKMLKKAIDSDSRNNHVDTELRQMRASKFSWDSSARATLAAYQKGLGN